MTLMTYSNIGYAILPRRRDLDRVMIDDGGDGAVLNAGRPPYHRQLGRGSSPPPAAL